MPNLQNQIGTKKKTKETDAANPENLIIFINNLRSLTIIPLLTWSRIGPIRIKAKKKKKKQLGKTVNKWKKKEVIINTKGIGKKKKTKGSNAGKERANHQYGPLFNPISSSLLDT